MPAKPARPSGHLRSAVVLIGICAAGAAGIAGAATLQLSGPPGASVRLGGQDLGLLPLAAPLDLEPGVYTVECRAAGYHDLAEIVVLPEPASWLHLRLRPLPLERRHALTASLFYAGLGQWHYGARLRGWLYFLGESGGLITALAGELQRTNHRDDYLNFKARYDEALVPADIVRWRGLADEAYRDMQDMASLRDTGLYVAAGAWVLSLLDTWLLFPALDVGPGMAPPAATAQVGAADRQAGSRAGLHAGLALRF